jgi:hypothetical protein
VLYRVLAHLLGPSNCVQIGESDLAKPYNLDGNRSPHQAALAA